MHRNHSSLALAVALGASIPAQAGPFEDLIAQIERMKNDPQAMLVVRFAQNDPQEFQVIGLNLGHQAGVSRVMLRQGAKGEPAPLPSQWQNSYRILGTLPAVMDDPTQEGMAVAAAVDSKAAGAGADAPVVLSQWLNLPARTIKDPLELISEHPEERLCLSEVVDIGAARTGIGTFRLHFERTQGHENNMVALAYGLTPAQVQGQIRKLRSTPVVAASEAPVPRASVAPR